MAKIIIPQQRIKSPRGRHKRISHDRFTYKVFEGLYKFHREYVNIIIIACSPPLVHFNNVRDMIYRGEKLHNILLCDTGIGID